jgi:hypothetical protein
MVRVEFCPFLMELGDKDLLSVGPVFAVAVTVRVPEAGLTLFPLLVFRTPAPSLLTYVPAVFTTRTRTLTVQEPLAGIVPPVNVKDLLPRVAVTVPPYVFVVPP